MASDVKRYSIKPEGDEFLLPEPEGYKDDFKRTEVVVGPSRNEEKETVFVSAVGSVGAATATIIVDTRVSQR